MSSKSSIFLTEDNEHCYYECNEPHYCKKPYIPENFIGDTIVLEMSKKNIKVICNDNEDLIIEILPGSELYKMIERMIDKKAYENQKTIIKRT